MLIPFGVLSAAGAGGGVAGDYELISTEILTSFQSSVTFSNLGIYSSTYKHLQIRMVARDDRAIDINNIFFTLNGDTGANYSFHLLAGTGSAVISDNGVSQSIGAAGTSLGTSGVANAFAPSILDILDPFSTTKNKTTRQFSGANSTASQIRLWSSNHRSTASMTSINLFPSGGSSFLAGSRFSLYGIRG
jgi:hypothetical protein